MSRKKRYKQQSSSLPVTIQKSYTLQDLDRLGQEIEIRKRLELERNLTSKDPDSIMKAVSYMRMMQEQKEGDLKSFLYNPDLQSLNTQNYRLPTKKLSYFMLRGMARTPVIRTVIGTRVDQVAGFAEPVNNEQEKGWMIRKKRGLFTEEKELTSQEKKDMEALTNFILEGGATENQWEFESFEEYLRELTYDSLCVDQMCFENVYTKGGKLVQFYPIDATTIRLVDNTDEAALSQYTTKYKGYWPKYCQVWQDQIHTFYYPWEMTFGVRNQITDINANGYGISELEDMIQIVTWLLFGMQYNGNFFSQGSNPKGFFSIKGNVPPGALADFKQLWRNTISGVHNSHKVPVIESGGADVNWINMQQHNSDMEFHQWLDFLTIIACCIFKIDPSECGFNMQQKQGIFGQDGQKQRLKHSQSKGLTPILRLIQRIITKYVINQLNSRYEFVFCGVETDDQVVALDMDVKKIQNGFMSLEDGFKKWSNRDFNPETDTILNNVWLQLQSQKMMGGQDMNAMTNNMGYEDEDVPSENPFEKAMINYLNRGV